MQRQLSVLSFRRGLAAPALVSALTAGILLTFLMGTGQAKMIQLNTGSDYAPYTSPDLPEGGLITELVRTVFASAGYETGLQFYPWKRGYSRVVQTTDDATFPYAWSQERADQVHYSRPINRIFIRVYSRTDSNLTFTQPGDLTDLTYCQPLGYQTEPELTALKEQKRLRHYEAPDMDSCFRLLSKNRVDFVISNDLVAAEAIERALNDTESADITAAAVAFREINEFLIISKSHPQGRQIMEQFNRSYETLLKNGQLDVLWQKHLGPKAKAVR